MQTIMYHIMFFQDMQEFCQQVFANILKLRFDDEKTLMPVTAGLDSVYVIQYNL